MRRRRSSPTLEPTLGHTWAIGDRVRFLGLGAIQDGVVVKLTDTFIHVKWTARTSGKTRIRPIARQFAGQHIDEGVIWKANNVLQLVEAVR